MVAALTGTVWLELVALENKLIFTEDMVFTFSVFNAKKKKKKIKEKTLELSIFFSRIIVFHTCIQEAFFLESRLLVRFIQIFYLFVLSE